MSHNSRLNHPDRALTASRVSNLVKQFGAKFPDITPAGCTFRQSRPDGLPPALTSPDGEVFVFVQVVPAKETDETLHDPPLGGVIFHHWPD